MSDSQDTIRIRSADGEMTAFVARPHSNAAAPAVIVAQEAFGVNQYIQEVTRSVAAAGYVAIAPDLLHRFEQHTVPYEEVATAKEMLAKLDDESVLGDVTAAVKAARDLDGVDGSRVGIIGFCFGGKVAYLAATAGLGLRAAVSFYGGGIAAPDPGAPVARTASIDCPILLVFGEDDPVISQEQVETIRKELEAARKDFRIEVFEGAGHGFACDARPATFHPDAAAAAWRITWGFLQDHLQG
jgi:carboxymethylenebutenolidase